MVRFTFAVRLDTDEMSAVVWNEIVERPDRIASTGDACDDNMRKLPGRLLHPPLDFTVTSDDLLVVSDDGRERVGTETRAYKAMRTGEVGHPFTHRFVDYVFQGLRARLDGNDLWSERMRV